MEILTTIGIFLTCIVGLYAVLKGKENLIKMIEKFVLEAEAQYKGIRKMGENKMIFVITKVRAYLPPFFGNLITDEFIAKAVDTILDTLEEYAKYQLDKFEKDTEKLETK